VAGDWMVDYASLICLGFDPSWAFPFYAKQTFHQVSALERSYI